MQTVRHKILIIDDTKANIEILYNVLQGGDYLFFARNGQDGLKLAARERPDLILLDIMMPDMDGYQVCTALKNDPRTSQIPVIFITAMGSVEDEAKGLECGAIDYLTKPISPPVVKARVKNHLELKLYRDRQESLIAELEKKNQQLDVLAREDGLTGLANRRHFDEVLNAEVNRATRTGQFLSLVLCDVDYFKRYNDHYGHAAGDGCLKVVGELLRSTFKRAGDLSARYGGEEFAAILPDTHPDSALHLADQLRKELVAWAVPHAQSEVLRVVTISCGVVGAQVTRERDAQSFIAKADSALYRSKESGRNRVTAAIFD